VSPERLGGAVVSDARFDDGGVVWPTAVDGGAVSPGRSCGDEMPDAGVGGAADAWRTTVDGGAVSPGRFAAGGEGVTEAEEVDGESAGDAARSATVGAESPDEAPVAGAFGEVDAVGGEVSARLVAVDGGVVRMGGGRVSPVRLGARDGSGEVLPPGGAVLVRLVAAASCEPGRVWVLVRGWLAVGGGAAAAAGPLRGGLAAVGAAAVGAGGAVSAARNRAI